MRRSQATLALILSISLFGASCRAPKQTTQPTGPITLTVWEVFDAPEVYDRIKEQYEAAHPNIKLNIVQKNYADYELEIANAVAAGIGPDVWMIRNDWLPKHKDKLLPMPEGLLASQGTKKVTTKGSNLAVLKNRYPQIVTDEATSGQTVYGIPLSIDTLALYYNKDHFQEAGINHAPTSWSEFVEDVPKLTQISPSDHTTIERAGAAMGTAGNVNRSSDILSLLMLQNRTPVTDQQKVSSLINGALPKEGGGLTYPGTEAVDFYTGFADPNKTVYTWNNTMPDSIDAFAQGQVSMIFSYGYLQRQLLQKNPGLNYGVAPMPQVVNTSQPVDYATYWLEVASRNTDHQAETWDFIKYLSEQGDTLYQQAADKPPAKKVDVVPSATERITNTAPGSPWSFQATTAQSWYKGLNPGKTEQILLQLIDNVVSFHQTSQVAIDNAAAQLTKTLQEKPY